MTIMDRTRNRLKLQRRDFKLNIRKRNIAAKDSKPLKLRDYRPSFILSDHEEIECISGMACSPFMLL